VSHEDLVIQVEGLSKMFRVYSQPVDLLKEFVFRIRTHQELWALKDVSFHVKQGQVVGLIGRNGSGKSTLLKILTGVLDKTSGELTINGRVSSILELGTGFHPEYSGRKNIFMGGMCLGMSRQEIETKINWVIEFSELKDFIDQPLRTYSTGMKARLAFSTAICMNPDILLLDEALSVGDVKFNRKCFEMINQLRSNGITIVLVSHDLNTVSNFCDKTILLDKGNLVSYGEPRDVTRAYYQLLFCEKEGEEDSHGGGIPGQKAGEQEELRQWARQRLHLADKPSETPHELRCGARDEAEIIDFGILDQEGNRVNLLTSGEKYTFFLYAVFHKNLEDPAFGFIIRDPKGMDLFGIGTGGLNYIIRPHRKGDILEGRVEVSMWLTNGEYFLSAGIGSRRAKSFDFRYDGLLFSINRHPLQQTSSVVNLQPVISHHTIVSEDVSELAGEKIASQ
jgi:ABC-type polysaccharide/polyol phosphate transport system ATPase subunit